ncbi:MAG: LacI family DNA-binding transcriptional regulator [Terracidiphilus sp.]
MKPPNIKDIAKALGISIGSVDRALHGRPDVSAATRARVLKKAEQLGYRPNVAARSLKLNRRLRIGAYFPEQISSFFDPLRAGVRAAASAAMGVNVDLVFHSFPRLDEGDVEMLSAAAARKFDGILIAPGNPDRIEPALRALAHQGVAIVCVASDAPRSDRVATVAIDAQASGAIAAELFSRTISKAGQLATITGELTTLDHAEKLRGFAATLALYAPHLTLLPAIESHENPRDAYRHARALLSRMPHPRGIYISTANSLPVLRALEEMNLFGDVQVIATDIFAEVVPFIESGKVLATLFQRPFTQGKTAFELLLHYLVDGSMPNPVTRLAPHIVLRSNLSLFNIP